VPSQHLRSRPRARGPVLHILHKALRYTRVNGSRKHS